MFQAMDMDPRRLIKEEEAVQDQIKEMDQQG